MTYFSRAENCINKKLGFDTGDLDENSKGIVKGPCGTEYRQADGKFCGGIDEYRGKFIGLLFISSIRAFDVLCHKMKDFLSFGSFRRAYLYSKISCRKLDFSDRVDKKIRFLFLRKFFICAYNFIAHPIKDLLKMGTLPIQIVAFKAIALLGVILPKPARHLAAIIQRVWEFDNILDREQFAKTGKKAKTSIFPEVPFFLGDGRSIAPCMLSKSDNTRLNNHLYVEDTHYRSFLSLYARLKSQITLYQDVFSKEFMEEVQKRLEAIKEDKNRIRDSLEEGEVYPDPAREQYEEALNLLEDMICGKKDYNEGAFLRILDGIDLAQKDLCRYQNWRQTSFNAAERDLNRRIERAQESKRLDPSEQNVNKQNEEIARHEERLEERRNELKESLRNHLGEIRSRHMEDYSREQWIDRLFENERQRELQEQEAKRNPPLRQVEKAYVPGKPSGKQGDDPVDSGEENEEHISAAEQGGFTSAQAPKVNFEDEEDEEYIPSEKQDKSTNVQALKVSFEDEEEFM